jgi:inosine/xanthosine triphosphate pyrophosphatase family protein
VTSSDYKRRETQIFEANYRIDGQPVGELFTFDVRSVQIKEVLEVDIALMVHQEVIQAYRQIKEPCIVEHASLIFDGFESYPGGLTKPMWNVLSEKFLEETRSAGRRARARAVIAYCDGQKVDTFVGETTGLIADSFRGSREFYWDTVFIPDTSHSKAQGKTYAEIADDPTLGLEFKVTQLSQSSRAMVKFLEYRRKCSPLLWPRS